jgi:amino acid transporter
LLPAYTVTGFDASAHTSEETVSASTNVPRGIVRSVLVSGLFGWAMLSAVVLAAPDPVAAAAAGDSAFTTILGAVLPRGLSIALFVGIALAQYVCGLATVTSASRMAYAFARDGGLPFSKQVRRVSPRFRTPAVAVWSTAILSVAFTLYARVYTTIAAVCVIFLYLSYVLPTALGFFAHGRSWTAMGPFTLGRWYRPLAATTVIGCLVLVIIGVQPPNDQALWIVLGCLGVAAAVWFGVERRRFAGPPVMSARAPERDG